MNATTVPVTSAGGPLLYSSTASERLFWTLNGPLESAIQVAPNPWYEPDAALEPYFRPAAAPGASPSWHPVSLESLMVPQVSATTVRVSCLEDCEMLWDEQHQGCRFEGEPGGAERFGPSPSGDAGPPFLLQCCGQKRPQASEIQLEVKTSGAFLTIHEYVSAVHPWLMAMRENLLGALAELDGRSTPWPPETKLAVSRISPNRVHINDVKMWAFYHRKPHVPQPGDVTLPMADGGDEEGSRRIRERMMARAAARVREREREAAAVAARAREMETIRID